jgi:hypothetical protein
MGRRYECQRCHKWGIAHYLLALAPDGSYVNVLVCTECFHAHVHRHRLRLEQLLVRAATASPVQPDLFAGGDQ